MSEFVCPICRGKLRPSWEISRAFWWNGLYTCAQCGDIKASGTWHQRGGHRLVEHWHPTCNKCGHDQVSIDGENYRLFSCWSCGQRMEVRASRLIRTRRPGRDEDYVPMTKGVVA
jgi:transcription elongation factor Elf1